MMKILMVLTSSVMMKSKTLMNMIFTIIMVCLSTATLMLMLSNSHWFSLFLVLIYISGVMVLFMFIVSLSPNEKPTMKNNNNIKIMVMIMLFYLQKFLASSESNKIGSSIEWSVGMMALLSLIIIMMAYLPPKVVKSLYKGMKSSK